MHACNVKIWYFYKNYQLQVCTSGVLTFDEFRDFYDCNPSEQLQVVVPFWQQYTPGILYYGANNVTYEVHRLGQADPQNLDTVNEYIQNVTGENFMGTWMLLAQWYTYENCPISQVNHSG